MEVCCLVKIKLFWQVRGALGWQARGASCREGTFSINYNRNPTRLNSCLCLNIIDLRFKLNGWTFNVLNTVIPSSFLVHFMKMYFSTSIHLQIQIGVFFIYGNSFSSIKNWLALIIFSCNSLRKHLIIWIGNLKKHPILNVFSIFSHVMLHIAL